MKEKTKNKEIYMIKIGEKNHSEKLVIFQSARHLSTTVEIFFIYIFNNKD